MWCVLCVRACMRACVRVCAMPLNRENMQVKMWHMMCSKTTANTKQLPYMHLRCGK